MELLQYHLGNDPVKKLVLPFLDILLVLECKRETDSTFKGGKCKNNWHILGTKAHVAEFMGSNPASGTMSLGY